MTRSQVFIGRFKYPFALIFILTIPLIAACSGVDRGEGCLVAEAGRFVDSSCEVAPGITVEPTATASVSDGSLSASPGFAIFRNSGCSGCHAISGTSAAGAIGPNLTGIQSKGESYVRESIVDPNAVVAVECPTGPCAANVMPANFGDILTPEDLDTLVSYVSGL